MRRFGVVLIALVAMTVAADSVWAQRGGAPSGGARPPPPGAPRGGAWHGAPARGAWHGSGWYSGWRGGWYGPGLGIYLGGPIYWGGVWPYAYGYPYPYSYSYPVYVPSAPPVYIEQNAPAAPVGYWYYCEEPAGYYPYVRECSRAWITVVPQNVPGTQAVPPLPR